MSAIYLKTKKKISQAGTTLLETIFYMLILTLIMAVIVQVFLAMSGVYKNIKAARELESSGTIVMDGMLREIRNASSVVLAQSILGTSPGSITVSGMDEDKEAYTASFTLSGGNIWVSRNGETPVALTPSSITASELLFTRASSTNSEGVRIELEVSRTYGSTTATEKFYGFTVLRGSY